MKRGKPKDGGTLSVEMTQDKETKGAIRYAANDADAPITTQYVRKSAFAKGKWPESVTVSLTWGAATSSKMNNDEEDDA